MADELIMGIDAGTSRVRVLVFEMDGTVVAQGSSEPKVDRPNPGWASTESEDLWSSCLEAMIVAVSEVAHPKRIRSIAVASVGEAAVPLDGKGGTALPGDRLVRCKNCGPGEMVGTENREATTF